MIAMPAVADRAAAAAGVHSVQRAVRMREGAAASEPACDVCAVQSMAIVVVPAMTKASTAPHAIAVVFTHNTCDTPCGRTCARTASGHTLRDAAAGTMKGQFDKKIHGKVLGDRSQILVTVTNGDANTSTIAIEAYPINPVGQKLQFGARKGVVPTVVGWFWAHVEHHLNN